ncbi:hypothetical protein F5Y01DRAFT_206954 [Xylaria sp. FL0043]|nr:hypothetical protein F5Y01DRAFT_206954 [Xylaria sp. FL0043]
MTTTTTFVTVSEISITDSVTSTASFTTTQVMTTVLPTTITLPPVTATLPPLTVTTVSVITEVSTCPIPTNSPGASVTPYDPRSDRTWGCLPGTVCSPTMPDGCNVYADLPDVTYVCGDPAWCIPSPAYPAVRWKDNITSYYPPTKGYFNLAPEAFGLSDDIFEINYVPTIVNGTLTTIATGNWGTQTGLTAYPPSTTSTTESAYITAKPRRLRSLALFKRGPTIPSICYDTCNNANLEAQAVGKTPDLCNPDSVFMSYYDGCQDCIAANADDVQLTERDYLAPAFAQWLDYCDSTSPTSPSGGGGQTQVSSTGPGTTEAGTPPASTTSAISIPSGSSSSSSSSSTSSSPSSSSAPSSTSTSTAEATTSSTGSTASSPSTSAAGTSSSSSLSSSSSSPTGTPSSSSSVPGSSSSPASTPPTTAVPTSNSTTLPSGTFTSSSPVATAGARGRDSVSGSRSLFVTLLSMLFLF